MSCGRPAVVTDVGGNAELCLDVKTGFVARGPTVAELSEALERAWQRQHDWPALGLAAHQRIQQVLPRDPVGEFCAQITQCVSGLN
jgi:glycosyltransferase involved in cell wall biosynthesis